MQKAILIPIRFLFFFLISVVIMGFFCLLYYWVETVSIDSIPGEVFFKNLPTVLESIIVPSISVSLLFSFFSLRNSSISVSAVIITTILVFIILFFGFFSLSKISNTVTDKAYSPLSKKMIQSTDDYIIYTDGVIERYDSIDEIENIILKKKKGSAPGFKYYHTGILKKKNNPVLVIDSEKEFDIVPANPVFSQILDPDSFLKSILGNITFLGKMLGKIAGKNKITLLFYSVVLTAFLMSCMLLRNSSRWPLIEIAGVFAFHAIAYLLCYSLSNQSDFITKTFLNGSPNEKMPFILLVVLTAVVFVIGILIRFTKGLKNNES